MNMLGLPSSELSPQTEGTRLAGYIAFERPAQKTPFPTVPLLLGVNFLMQKGVYRADA
jgi:hypothetical protein